MRHDTIASFLQKKFLGQNCHLRESCIQVTRGRVRPFQPLAVSVHSRPNVEVHLTALWTMNDCCW